VHQPDFFIVGAPKCATTAFNRYLGQHPQIFIPARKELHYFGSDLKFLKGRTSRGEYLAQFASVRLEKRVGEASVWYLYSRRAAAEIKAFAPRAQIIILLRNPADMLYSLHSQFLYESNENILDIRRALAAERDRKQGRRIPPNIYFLEGLFYRDVARYCEQVERYLHLFGSENVLVICYDDFKRNTRAVYRETLRFLHVDEEFEPRFEVLNGNKEVRNHRFQFFLNNPPPAVLGLSRLLIPTRLRHLLVDGLKRLNSRKAGRKPLSDDLRRQLEYEFEDEVCRLGRLLDRDLSHWCGRAPPEGNSYANADEGEDLVTSGSQEFNTL